jgi:hypothetical protein
MLDTSYTSQPITIDIPNLIINDTVIMRKATLMKMDYDLENKTLSLSWYVKHFSSDNGKCGEYLGLIIQDKIKKTIADNTTFVDPNTGAFIYPDTDGFVDIPYMGQFDFFNKIATYQPIIVNNLIIQYGQQTNWQQTT